MFKNFFQRFYKREMPGRELILVGACIKSPEDNYLCFDEAEQAIEYTYHWYSYTDKPYGARMTNGGYFPITSTNIIEVMEFSRYVHSLLDHRALPVIFSNSCKSFTECIAEYLKGKMGVINLNHRVDLVSKIGFVPMQSYASVMTDETDVQMLSLGVYEDMHYPSELTLAETMGVRWVSSTSFNSLELEEIYRKLEGFLFVNGTIALNIDLKSIVRGMTQQIPFALDFDLVLSVIQKCMNSNKVILVHLTGDNDELIFSKEVKQILDVVRAKIEDINHVA